MNLVGIDVGGGGIRLRGQLGGQSRRAARAQSIHVGSTIESSGLADAIATVVADSVSPDERIDVLVVGMTGFPDLFPEPERMRSAIEERVRARQVVLAADALTAHVGALGFSAGAVIAAGTGAVALGTDLDRIWRRVDGWGHLLGDTGSGAWIGRRGLQAAFRTIDGRADGSELLAEHLRTRFGDIPSLVAELYRADAPSRFTSRFTPSVADAARAGDAVALEIWAEGARTLAATAVAAMAGVTRRGSWAGGVFAAEDLIRAPFEREVARLAPDAVVLPPEGDPSDGALRLAQAVAEGWHADAERYVLFSAAG